MRHRSFLHHAPWRWRSLASVVGCSIVAAVVACGSISDPTRGEPVGTITGALVGSDVPANARVALVWKVGVSNRWAVGPDVAVVGGKFTMQLAAPPADYLSVDDGTESWMPWADAGTVIPRGGDAGAASSSSGGMDAGAAASSSGSSGASSGMFDFGRGLAPRDAVSGSIATPLRVAFAGFVVYVDKNGNHSLDIEGESVRSPDEVIGGHSGLVLEYFAGGGALDFERRRDRVGMLPTAGYNLRWVDQARWLPLDAIELTLGPVPLPFMVCERDGGVAGGDHSGDAGAGAWTREGDAGAVYPSPEDPYLFCSADGRYFTYHPPCTTPTTPTSLGLCGGYYDFSCPPPYGDALVQGADVPPGWPCTIHSGADGGIDPIDSADGGAAGDGGF